MNARSGDPLPVPVVVRVGGSIAEVAAANYEATYEQFAETAQLYAGTPLAETVAATAMLFLLAADAERNDPEPSVSRSCACVSCRMYALMGDKRPSDTEYVDVHPHVRPVADCPRCA